MKEKITYCHVNPFHATQRLNGRYVYFIEHAISESHEETVIPDR